MCRAVNLHKLTPPCPSPSQPWLPTPYTPASPESPGTTGPSHLQAASASPTHLALPSSPSSPFPHLTDERVSAHRKVTGLPPNLRSRLGPPIQDLGCQHMDITEPATPHPNSRLQIPASYIFQKQHVPNPTFNPLYKPISHISFLPQVFQTLSQKKTFIVLSLTLMSEPQSLHQEILPIIFKVCWNLITYIPL